MPPATETDGEFTARSAATACGRRSCRVPDVRRRAGNRLAGASCALTRIAPTRSHGRACEAPQAGRRRSARRPARGRPRLPAGARAPPRADRALAAPAARASLRFWFVLLVPARGERAALADDLARDRAALRALDGARERRRRAQRGSAALAALADGEPGVVAGGDAPADARARSSRPRSTRRAPSVGVVWLRERGRTLVVAGRPGRLGALAAELEGLRAPSPAATARAATDAPRGRRRTRPTRPVAAARRRRARARHARAAPRAASAFDADASALAALAADLAALAVRPLRGRRAAGRLAGRRSSSPATRSRPRRRGASRAAAIARLAGDRRRARRRRSLWRRARRGVDARAARTARSRATPALAGRRRASRCASTRAVAVARSDRAPGRVVTLQLGQPPLGALQLVFPPGGAPGRGRARPARDLRRPGGARAALVRARARRSGFELERSRALLAVVGEAIAQLSLAHTLETALERVAELLGTDRVAVYLREDGRSPPPPRAALAGRTSRSRSALLELALGPLPRARHRRGRRRRCATRGSTASRAEAAEAEHRGRVRRAAARRRTSRSACSPSTRARPRRADAERVGAARRARRAARASPSRTRGCTSSATQLGRELESALASEREEAKRLQRALRDLALVRAEPLARDDARRARARRRELLGVDAAVIRMPDERGVELVARAMHVADERLDAAARALLSRPQPLASAGRRLLRAAEPLVLDAGQREELGGALGAARAPSSRRARPRRRPDRDAGELLATLTIVSLHPDRPVAGEIAETALSIAGQAALAIDNARLYEQQKAFADTMQRSLLPREAPRAARPRARRRLRVVRPRRRRRRRLRLPHARGRPPRGRARRRDGARDRRDGGHGDGEVRLPLARARAPRAGRLPRGRERGRRRRDRAGQVHHDGRGRDRRRARRGRVRERRPSRAAARAAGRHGRADRRRAGSRSASTRRSRTRGDGRRSRPAPPSSSTPTASSRRGAAASSTASSASTAARRAPRAAGRGDRAGGARGLPRVDGRRARRRLRRRRDQADVGAAAREPRSQRGPLAARLRRRHGLARGRDRGVAPARAVLRLLDDRVGEPDRDRPRGARARLLARRQARRPAPGAAAAGPDRARRRRCGWR